MNHERKDQSTGDRSFDKFGDGKKIVFDKDVLKEPWYGCSDGTTTGYMKRSACLEIMTCFPKWLRYFDIMPASSSIQLAAHRDKKRAGDGNRTHVSSLEGWCSTIELHPHDTIGVTGFEPAASWSQTRRSSQAEPHPVLLFWISTVLYKNSRQLSTIFQKNHRPKPAPSSSAAFR